MKLKEFNAYIYDEYLNFRNIEELSCPLLVSSHRYENIVNNNPILYIGEETNGWVNDVSNNTLENIEQHYDEFLIDFNTSKTIFWQFIKNVLNTDYNNLCKNIIWANTLIVGKKHGKGSPILDDNIKRLSLEYLLFLQDYFKPRAIINVSGNNCPYYNITKTFLETNNIDVEYPSFNNPVNINNNYIWTYHPQYLRMSKNEEFVLNKIKKKIN